VSARAGELRFHIKSVCGISLMEIIHKIDDIVWGDSDVWDDTFFMLVHEAVNPKILVDVVMKWVMSKHDEYKAKYFKVLEIKTGLLDTDSVLKLAFHYQKIMCRYRIVHDCCKTAGFIL
jgi:hypothetical protein